jgi:hypothetical protein
LADTLAARRLFAEVFAERRLARSLDPVPLPLLYDRDVSGTTFVLVTGMYGELFDGELWTRGVRAVRERFGMRTLVVPMDGRCGSATNARQLVDALRADTRRRTARGHPVPRYLLVGYSKGGVDATEALRLAPDLARSQVAALVTVGTPLLGSPVAERAALPDAVLSLAVATPRPPACDAADVAASVQPATRAAFWAEHGAELSGLVPLLSVSFVTAPEDAHPWMRITKRIAGFREANDGVVALSASRFPAEVPSVDLGTVMADHIVSRLASAFPQDAFMEALVATVAELGVLEPGAGAVWRTAAARRAVVAARAGRRTTSFAADVRTPAATWRSGAWTPARTFTPTRGRAEAALAGPVATRRTHPDGLVFRCDQRDMTAFRREYEFMYDAGSGGREHDPTDGFALMPESGAANGRACHLASRGSAVKMITVAHRFAPAQFPEFAMRLRVTDDLTGVDASRAGAGRNDAALKVWLLLRDGRTGDDHLGRFAYVWAGPDARGVVPAEGTLQEAAGSRRSLLVTTLPEAWVVTVGGPAQRGRWVTIRRDLASDLRRAYPAVPVEAWEVQGLMLQTDSDETRGRTALYLESFGFGPGAAASVARR